MMTYFEHKLKTTDVSLGEFMYVVFIACQVCGVIVGDSSLCCCGPVFNAMCDVNCSSAITSHCLLILKTTFVFLSISNPVGLTLLGLYAILHVRISQAFRQEDKDSATYSTLLLCSGLCVAVVSRTPPLQDCLA